MNRTGSPSGGPFAVFNSQFWIETTVGDRGNENAFLE